MEGLNPFLARHKENADMNQYWYSKTTINFMASQVEIMMEEGDKTCAFLSVPSVYFSVKNKEIKSRCKNLDFDENFGKKDSNFVFFDFNKIENIPEDLHHKFDMVVIDPPFITREVWEKYAEISRLLLKEEGGHALLSTIDENEEMILELMGAKRRAFRPSIPNLVYQYSFYTTYEHPDLDEKNAEIPEFD